MSDLLNFRDFGGAQTRDGHRVKQERLFRSGHLCGLGPDAMQRLLAHDFALVVDLRYGNEREAQRSPWPAAVLDRVIAHDGSANREAPHLALRRAIGEAGDVDRAFRQLYADLPFGGRYRPLFARAVQQIADASGPILIHCSAGKDRTGTFVALLLDLLGVPEAAITADYLKTNGAPGMERLREDAKRGWSVEEDRIDALLRADASYLGAALAAVRDRHGSSEAYFIASGVDPATLERLRSTYLIEQH